VFVVQPPYLLFYPDKNHDNVPDSDPEVLLRGFGMEDAHAFAKRLFGKLPSLPGLPKLMRVGRGLLRAQQSEQTPLRRAWFR
jgi:hypothetical protein